MIDMLGNAFNMIAVHREAFFILVGAVILLFFLLNAFRSRRPPYRRGRFLSDNEKQFFHVLDEALGENYRVFAQVRLADLVDIGPGANDARRHAAMKKVFAKSIDFVICDAVTLDPIAAIEVDDSTHLLTHRQERDAFVNAVFREIGLPLLRTPARRNYTPAMLRKMLTSAGLDLSRRESAFRGRPPS